MTLAPAPLLDEAGAPAPAQRKPRARVRTAGFPAMPLDVSEFYAADLTAPQRGVWMALRMHIWFHGALPRTAKGLAEIGRVHVRTWAAMEEAIAPHFDLDEDGRWRHFDLEAEREAALASRVKRSKANKENAEARWRSAAEDGDEATGETASRDANGIANGSATEAQDGLSKGSSGLPPVEPRASSAGGQSDRRTLVKPKEKIEETDGRTDPRRAGGADDQPADRSANGSAALAAGAPASQTETDGKTAIATEASDVASQACTDATQHANGIAGSDASTTAPAPIADTEIFRALRDGAGDRIPAHLLTREGIAPIRMLMADGCDFARDVAPAFVAGARGLKRPLDSLRAGFLHEMARANRDEAARRSAPETAAAQKVFVEEGTPEWQAWLARLGRKSFPRAQNVVDGVRKTGWWFDKRSPTGAPAATG